MADRKPPTNVLKLLGDALGRIGAKDAAKHIDATVAGRIKLRKAVPPKNNGKGK
jgi:hypothetical protein